MKDVLDYLKSSVGNLYIPTLIQLNSYMINDEVQEERMKGSPDHSDDIDD
jgi:hypothetical protein